MGGNEEKEIRETARYVCMTGNMRERASERERGSERQRERERERQSKRERERERERQRERESQSTFYILQVAAGPMYWVHNLNKTVGKRREREQGKGERNRDMYG